VKTRAIISDSDFKTLGTAEASARKRLAAAAMMSESEFEPVVTAKALARKHLAAAAKPRKRVRKPVKVVLVLSLPSGSPCIFMKLTLDGLFSYHKSATVVEECKSGMNYLSV